MKIQRFAGNFKPTFWSNYVQTELEKDLVVAKWSDYTYDGEIEYKGRVTIVGTVRPKIGKYEPGKDINIEKLGDNAQYLDIDYADYFAFEVDDVDKAQSKKGYLDKQFDEAKKALAEEEDHNVATVAALGALQNMTSESTAIYELSDPLAPLDVGLIKLRKNNVPLKEKLAADLNADHIGLIKKALSKAFSDNVEYIKNGAIGEYNNILLRLSNNLYNDGKDDFELLRTKKAVAAANAIRNIETCRKEKGFASIVKGLNVYGAKVVRPKELYVIKAH